jgi:hypothetical protein
MYKKSFEPTPVNQINFGKYKGQTFEQVYQSDPDYVRWLRDTCDPADVKNEGKYAKQNQARIKYLDNLLTVGVTIGVDEMPKETPKVSQAPAVNVNAKTFESILQILLKLEEKMDVLLDAAGKKAVVTKSEMAPDEEAPW